MQEASMSSRKRPYQKKPFESTGASNDTSANLYMSMLLSPAWRALSAQQQRLYLYCKAQYYAEKHKPDGDNMSFTMNQSKWGDLYNLYEKSNAKGFYRDMSALIEHGFIVCVACGATTRTKSVYRFSSMWQKYGTADFSVSAQEITQAAARRRKDKENNANGNLY